MKMPRLRSILIIFLLSGTVSTPSIAQAQTIHRCEQYTNINGTTAYRVTPSIAGSFGFFNPSNPFRECFVPITSKQCRYKSTSGNQWSRCGVPEKGQVFSLGVGEIVENNGKNYHAFQNGVEFAFE